MNEGLRCLIDALAARPTSPYVRLFAVNDVGLEWSDGTCSTWRVRTGAEALENLIAANLWAPDEEVSWGCAHCDRTGRDPRERIGWRSLFCTLCKGRGAVPNPPYVSDAWAWAAVGAPARRTAVTVTAEFVGRSFVRLSTCSEGAWRHPARTAEQSETDLRITAALNARWTAPSPCPFRWVGGALVTPFERDFTWAESAWAE